MGAPAIKTDSWKETVVEVCKLVSKLAGIQLQERHHPMVENRLRSRLLKLGITSPEAYRAHLAANEKSESEALVSLMTTHHTYFFREFAHFEHLLKILGSLVAQVKSRKESTLRIWSAACSRGQEVYSMAMFFDFHLKQIDPSMKFEILGTDVDGDSVKIASNGVYLYNEIKEIPQIYLQDHWVRGTKEISDYAKVKAGLKERCRFETLNLLDPAPWIKSQKFDVVFCRNVFIYFSPQQIKQATQFLMGQLYSEGHFFIGISETLTGLNLDVESVGPSIYRTKGTGALAVTPRVANGVSIGPKASLPAAANAKVAPMTPPISPIPSPIRVLCVDDSPSVLTLLKKILGKEFGFEVVATASNGREAEDCVKRYNPHILTLDIHMPEMDGVTYLKTYMNANHPPVVVLSTVNRENADLAIKTLELGASDYVEKPQLSNLSEKGEELRSKMKTAILTKSAGRRLSDVEIGFKRKFEIPQPEKKARVVLGGLGHIHEIQKLARDQNAKDPAMVFFFEGAGDALASLANEVGRHSGKTIETDWAKATRNGIGQVFFLDHTTGQSFLKASANRKLSVFVLGLPTVKTAAIVMNFADCHLLLQDLGPHGNKTVHPLKEVASDTAPVTSYLSLSEEYYVAQG